MSRSAWAKPSGTLRQLTSGIIYRTDSCRSSADPDQPPISRYTKSHHDRNHRPRSCRPQCGHLRSTFNVDHDNVCRGGVSSKYYSSLDTSRSTHTQFVQGSHRTLLLGCTEIKRHTATSQRLSPNKSLVVPLPFCSASHDGLNGSVWTLSICLHNGSTFNIKTI